MKPTLLNESGAADYLGVGVHRVRSWRTRRTGPAYLKIGQAVRYDTRDLDAWLTEQRVEPEPPMRGGRVRQGRVRR
ncbi:helix-turn-helix domain-containing protein [Tsukamurella sp. USMM236]|uniref:helix-turn-helix domain-containing protein n=1 Tax=Tsukamurella sp. USMM236 TaxID=3081301 RepID=UPI003FCCA8F1